MLKPAARAAIPTFEELKKRGDRAMENGQVAVQKLRVAVLEAQQLRQHIDQVHHQKS